MALPSGAWVVTPPALLALKPRHGTKCERDRNDVRQAKRARHDTFIRLPPLLKTRRQLFDIGVARWPNGRRDPALALGLRWSAVLPVEETTGGGVHMAHGVSINASILLALVSKAAIGDALTTGH